MTDHSVIIIGGGQSGLTAARAARQAGLSPVILEAADRPVGAWPHYYDSLTLFSPAQLSALPGLPLPVEPEHYPHRDEIVTYLSRYADTLDVEVRTGTRVTAVTTGDNFRYRVHTADGQSLRAAGVIAASGSFGNPYLPSIPGQDGFTGRTLHVADYRNPRPYAGQRILVVGAGNSAVQVGYELAQVATVSLATRAPLHFIDQQVLGRDVHHWLTGTGIDRLPAAWLASVLRGTPVLDSGRYREAIAAGRPDRRPMFTRFDGDRVVWSDGSTEPVDTVIFATGYRPDLSYLRPLDALDDTGAPRHRGGVSTTCPGLVFVGLEFQRSLSSNTLRGVHRDAKHVIAPLAAQVRDSLTMVGLHP